MSIEIEEYKNLPRLFFRPIRGDLYEAMKDKVPLESREDLVKLLADKGDFTLEEIKYDPRINCDYQGVLIDGSIRGFLCSPRPEPF